MLKALSFATVAGAGVGTYMYSKDGNGVEGVARFSRAFYNGAVVVFDYKYSLRGLEMGQPEYNKTRSAIHARAAHRLLHVCQEHGGIYVKFGQYLASMNHVIPKEYTETLKVLQDRNPFIELKKIEQTIFEEFGKTIPELYREFTPEPIAAASLAQVHHAVTHSGQEVAVKVQYPHLQKEVRSDIKGMRFLTALIGKIFPDYQYSWLMPEFEESILQELDFVQEAVNSERVKRMFRDRQDIHVPFVVWDLTSMRVLTQEFIHGCKVTDVEKIAAMGVDSRKVATSVSVFFGDMVYVHGFVHCDPHPGNLMVRAKAGDTNNQNTYQVVILDHGMYRTLQSSFRAAYSELWKSFVTLDAELGLRAAIKLGISEDHYEDIVLLFAPPGANGANKMTPERRAQLRRKYEGKGMRDVNQFLESLPRDLLFVFRSQNLVRSLSINLGGTVGERTQYLGESALRGLALNEALGKIDYDAIRMLETDDILGPSVRRKVPPLPPVEDYEIVDPMQTNPAPLKLSVIALRDLLQPAPTSRWYEVAYPYAYINKAVDSELLRIDMQTRPELYKDQTVHSSDEYLLRWRLWVMSTWLWMFSPAPVQAIPPATLVADSNANERSDSMEK